jgi:tetratricopeptide (TPR) repeat protein
LLTGGNIFHKPAGTNRDGQPIVNRCGPFAGCGIRPSSARLIWLLGLLLVLATLVLYYPVAHFDFLNFDDNEYVTANAHVRAGLSWQNTGWAFTSLEASNWHPVTWLSHMLDCQLFGLNAGKAHLVNLLLHALNALLLFVLLQRATGAVWRSLLVAAIFALHPLNVETVAWIAERKSLLSMSFTLITAGLYGWYVQGPRVGRYLAVVAALVLALMAKPMAVTVPLLLLLLDQWPLSRCAADGQTVFGASWTVDDPYWTKMRSLLLEKTPLFLLAAVSAGITIIAQRRGGSIAVEAALPLSFRLNNAAFSSLEYIRKMFWPDKLAVFYPHPEASLAGWKVLLSLLVLSAVTAAVIRFRRAKYLPVGWLIYVVTLLPVLGIIQVGRQAMADRYAYVPLIGLFIAVVWGTTALADHLALGVAARSAAALGVLLVLAGTASNALPYWRNSLVLFTRASRLASRPDRAIEDNLGEALFSAGRYEEAMPHFTLAVMLFPQDSLAHYNIGTYWLVKDQPRTAIREFQTALQTPENRNLAVSCYNNLAVALLQLGDFDGAERNYTAALQLFPNHFHALLGRGQAAYYAGRYRQAMNDFSAAVRIVPDPAAFLWQGKTLQAEGDLRGATAAYQEALRRDAGLTEASIRIKALTAEPEPPKSDTH